MKFDYVFGENVEFMYPSVTIHIERIYPSQAEQMLKTNFGNRSMKSLPIAEAITGGWGPDAPIQDWRGTSRKLPED